MGAVLHAVPVLRAPGQPRAGSEAITGGLRCLVLLLCMLLLAGCVRDDPATALLEDYRTRMARVLDVDPDPLAVPPLVPWPRGRERTLAIPAQRASLREFLQLQQCALGPLIGARSGALGRVMQPSQRLQYELRFLRQARLCRERSADPARAGEPLGDLAGASARDSAGDWTAHAPARADAPAAPDPVDAASEGPAPARAVQEALPAAGEGGLARADEDALALLDEVLRIKREQLGAVVWNATLGDAALAAHLALDVGPLPPERAAGAGRDATGALQRLTAVIRGADRDAPLPPDWEQPWQTLDRSVFGGETRRSMALLTAVFDDVADWIELREAQRPVCPLGRPTPAAEILRNVFWRYYAARVQPYLANVSTRAERWLEAMEALRGVQPAEAPAGFDARVAPVLDRYAQDSEWQRLVQARDRHTRAWQALLERCNLGPGSD